MAKIPFSTALRTYRTETLQLSQLQFAALVGMGVATINRYENGGNSTPAHSELLASMQEPAVLKQLLIGKVEALGEETYRRLTKLVEVELSASLLKGVARLLNQETDLDLTGNRNFDLERFKQMVVFFTQQGEWKTKLNKLLFYADFCGHRANKKSISGAKYVIGHFGPIPDRHEQLYAGLLESNILVEREEFLGPRGEPVEKLVALEEFKRHVFSLTELRILDGIKDFFRDMPARVVAEYSHDEVAYQSHTLGEAIPYYESKTLKPILKPEPKSKKLSEIAKELAAQIPKEELAKVPTDASTQVDHYLYGSPKRKI